MAPLVVMAIGGAARIAVDELPDDALAHGADADLSDGKGVRCCSGLELFFHLLLIKFPGNQEARVLRAALEFFSFKPRREETVQMVIMRFDHQCDKVSEAAGFELSYQLRSFLLMCILRLTQVKWSEYLKRAATACRRIPPNTRRWSSTLFARKH